MEMLDLESLKQIFQDKKTHLVVGQVKKLGLAQDRSVLRAQCLVLTEEREVIARVCWEACHGGGGSFQFPVLGDLVLLQFAEGSDDQIYLTKRLSNREDLIPLQAVSGDLVHRSIPSQKLHLLSDTQILIGRGGDHADANEPLVLGNQLKTMLSSLLATLSTQAQAIQTLTTNLKTVTDQLNSMATDLSTHTHMGFAPGNPTSPPISAASYVLSATTFQTGSSHLDTATQAMGNAKSAFDSAKSSPIDNGVILSNLSFTEKGV